MKKFELVSIKEILPTDTVILAMGATGTGKSTFVDLATGQRGKTIGHTLESKTTEVRAVRIRHPLTGKPIIFVDTPGFGCTNISNGEVLRIIAIWLQETYRKGIQLTGIVYMHRITDNRLEDPSLPIFLKLCGEQALSNVVFSTSMWNRLRKDIGERREVQLRKEYREDLMQHGVRIARFDGTSLSSWKIVDIILNGPEPKSVFLQEEMVDLGKRLSDTQAGIGLYDAVPIHAEAGEGLKKGDFWESDPELVMVSLDEQQEKVEEAINQSPNRPPNPRPPLAKRIPTILSFVKLPLIGKPKNGPRIYKSGSGGILLDEPPPGLDTKANTKAKAAVLDRLESIFGDIEQYRKFLDCKRLDSQSQALLDLFQKVLEEPTLNPQFRRDLVIATQRLSKQTNLYPKCFTLEDLGLVDTSYVASGSSADVYKSYVNDGAVCLKVIRLQSTAKIEYTIKCFYKEAILWGQLSHPNLLPFHGLYYFQNRLCLVSPWASNGHVRDYVHQNPLSNRVLLALDTINGVSYLHDNNIVHGDLKGENILVDDFGRSRLADFGISSVTDRRIQQWTSQSSPTSKRGTTRWQAPEISGIENDEFVPNTKASDIYAWACVSYEIFTGLLPFFEIKMEHAVLFKVISGQRPSRPSEKSAAWLEWGLTKAIWSLLQTCWEAVPSQRPCAKAVVTRLMNCSPINDTRPTGSWGEFLLAQCQSEVGKYPSAADLEGLLRELDV